jgi:hypothetical protein
VAPQPKSGPRRLVEVPRPHAFRHTHTHKQTHTHTHTHTHTAGLIWASDQLVPGAATYTTFNKHKRRTFMPSAGFERAIPVIERPQTYALDQTTTGIGVLLLSLCKLKRNSKKLACICHRRCMFHIIPVTVTKFILTGFTTQSLDCHR